MGPVGTWGSWTVALDGNTIVYRAGTVTLGPYEFVTGVHGLYGPYSYGGDDITGFTIVTNLRTYGPFGVSGSIKEPPMSLDIPVMNNVTTVTMPTSRPSVSRSSSCDDCLIVVLSVAKSIMNLMVVVCLLCVCTFSFCVCA